MPLRSGMALCSNEREDVLREEHLAHGLKCLALPCQMVGHRDEVSAAAAGLLESFDAAAKMQDRDRMIELLRRTDLGDEAVAIAETILANPKHYGF